ncbi:hypothetical protein CEK26_013208 [Fusarium fujikuroi]|uniref:Uncharacterized protein n=1 Tax=Fusarium fujikuroi TaxID=5127 RepID=A0A0I9X7Q4_FUSFU|nr:Uncharacterized protein LW93_13282 [Fusarium fujikuroi]KLO91027.1 Uncharacterized protein LW94_10080 [Fusarium fujikuroi]KLP10791.1 Uncharacterized protein Y057_2857 [Fusarium fujikuroi]QGI86615.1 hypothetical protein CEK25_013344 [Fusarium fujikuroi]QGJ00140.1 hypothetical protein CEK26_013208 [Fusarium fujikuroi]
MQNAIARRFGTGDGSFIYCPCLSVSQRRPRGLRWYKVPPSLCNGVRTSMNVSIDSKHVDILPSLTPSRLSWSSAHLDHTPPSSLWGRPCWEFAGHEARRVFILGYVFVFLPFICTGQTGEKVQWTAIGTANDPRHNSPKVLYSGLLTAQDMQHIHRAYDLPGQSLETWHTQEEIEPSIQTINITGPVVLRPLLSSPIGTCSLLYCTTTTPPEAEPSPAQLSPPEESRRKNFGCSNAPDRDHDLTEYSAFLHRIPPSPDFRCLTSLVQICCQWESCLLDFNSSASLRRHLVTTSHTTHSRIMDTSIYSEIQWLEEFSETSWVRTNALFDRLVTVSRHKEPPAPFTDFDNLLSLTKTVWRMVRFNSIHSPLTLACPAGSSLRVIVNGNFVTCRSDLEFRFFNVCSLCFGFQRIITTLNYGISQDAGQHARCPDWS